MSFLPLITGQLFEHHRSRDLSYSYWGLKGWVNGTARWRCPEGVVIFSVVDLDMPLPLALVWRRDDTSPLLENFIASQR
jgi:hypothetical protein